MIEYKNAGAGIQDVDSTSRTVVAYAATFRTDPDRANDIITKGAFARTLNNNSQRVKVMREHSPLHLIGVPTKMHEDEKGLYTETRFSDIGLARDTLQLIQEGILTDASIGYRAVKSDFDRDAKARMLREIRLFEYSFVAIPADDQANVTNVKSLGGLQHIIDTMGRMEKALRDMEFESDEVPERMEAALLIWREQLKSLQELGFQPLGDGADSASATPADADSAVPADDSGVAPTHVDGEERKQAEALIQSLNDLRWQLRLERELSALSAHAATR
jgi:HK97 family phage prohead protease